MNAIPLNPMLEATRLTREGRLPEAAALLQRLLRGDGLADETSATPNNSAGTATDSPRIVDIDPETGDALPPDPVFTAKADRKAGGPLPASGAGRTAWRPMPEAPHGLFGHGNQAGSAQGLARKWPAGLSGLAAGLSSPGPTKQPAAPLPAGAAFTAGSFSGDAGTGGYKLYIPSTHRGTAAPLVVMLHGCTQSPDDFAAGTRMNHLAEEHGFLVVYPGQTQAANAQKCWNWFSPADQQRDRGEPALIAGITRQVMRDHAVDPRRVFVAGLSAGGAAAAIMGVAYHDLYAAVGVHSGLACGAARDMPSAFAAMRQGAAGQQPEFIPAADGGRRVVPTIVFHADKDATVHPRNGDQVIAQSAAAVDLRTVIERGQVPGGHAYSRTIHADANGQAVHEQWLVHGGGHAWSGGSTDGSYTDPRGPDASREMLRFFLEHPSSIETR